MQQGKGKQVWVFPDGELPPAGDFELKAHESLIILNQTENDANIKMTLFFTDREPIENIPVVVAGRRVRCLRTNEPKDMGGVEVPREVQYSITLVSDTPIVAQYGRLDTRDQPMAFYTSAGYCE